jgi:hypothetical protein
MTESRNIVIDCTESEARRVIAALDVAAALSESCSDGCPEVIREMRDRFWAGIAISQAEQILRGGSQ